MKSLSLLLKNSSSLESFYKVGGLEHIARLAAEPRPVLEIEAVDYAESESALGHFIEKLVKNCQVPNTLFSKPNHMIDDLPFFPFKVI